jgi:hypothetical protein
LTSFAEAAWGADLLEYYGGFPILRPEDNAAFKSSLTPNGTVTWSTAHSSSSQPAHGGVKVSLSVKFSKVDWIFLQSIYGWAALQWQAWARGEIIVNSNAPVTATLYTDHILEYALDGVRYFGGDFYAFQKAPLVVHLTPGKHTLDVRVVRDIRAMGGVGEPTVDFDIELVPTQSHVGRAEGKILVSDVVDGVLPSPYGSVRIRNNGKEWIEVINITSVQSQVSAHIPTS